MKNEQTIYINEQHLDGDATKDQAQQMIAFLRARDWNVAYGETLSVWFGEDHNDPQLEPQFDADWAECLDTISEQGDVLDAVMTAGEVAKVYGLSDDAVSLAARRGSIPARKSGGTWLIKRSDAQARWGNRNEKTLLEILLGGMAYDSSWGIYAERIGGEFKPESPARFGQRQFKNGGLLDDKKFFFDNESITDRMSSYLEGADEPEDWLREEAALEVIDQANEELKDRE